MLDIYGEVDEYFKELAMQEHINPKGLSSTPDGCEKTAVSILQEHADGKKAEIIKLTPKGKVFIFGSFAKKATENLFRWYGYHVVPFLDDADILCLLGGDDINPKLYGEEPSGAIGWNDHADEQDIAAIKLAKDKIKIGICRGAQMLNVYPNGGTLWQDVSDHNRPHAIKDEVTGMKFQVNSIHHQQIRLTDKAELVAYADSVARVKKGFKRAWHCDANDFDVDVEAAWYPDTHSLLFQPHPEFDIDGPTGIYFNQLLNRYLHAA